ncbi:hypothetical protein FACS1894180_5810 [Bacteroidia bacterium]|nr:hypothetical protein FACS1894180_5810 [Bacteroidia bacterium]
MAVFSTIISLNSCKTDDYEEWKIMNENWYSRAKIAFADSVGYQTTASGLIYKIIEPGFQRRPNDNSTLHVKYSGTLIDGTVFRSSNLAEIYQSIEPAGWREALKMIQDGGHIKFVMPYQLGYGESGSGLIPPYSALIFDVKLYQSFN